MPSVYSTSSDDLGATAGSYDNINDFLLTESQVQSSQDVRIYFSPEELKDPFFEVIGSKGDEEESIESLNEENSVVQDREGSEKLLSEENEASSEERIKSIFEGKELLEAALDIAKKEVLVLSNDKRFVRSLLELSELDLKSLGQSKNIELRGQTKNKRNNFIVKLLEQMDD
jgi:hypothetical protein